MGSGAPKKFDVIPISQVTVLLAAQANADESWRNLATALERVFTDQDDAKAWSEVERLRTEFINRSRFFTSAVNTLLRSQQNV